MALPQLLDAVAALPAYSDLVAKLPSLGETITIGGLPGSSDATLSAALGRELGATRFQVILAEALPEAERWLADLDALAMDGAVALYPPREGFGEAEPHLEVAGERVETLERIARGEVRTLVTTARAVLERTRLPSAVRNSRLELKPDATQKLDALIAHLESVGFERVTLVDDVAQFSVRGGIVDIYSFGMANPVRLELWGDEIASLRHFDLASQRSTRDAASAIILPVDGRRGEDNESSARGTLAELFPPDTLIVVPSRSHLEAEMRRTWTRPRTTSTSRAGAARMYPIATSSFRRRTRRNASLAASDAS